jgi:micrococcal nuclease
VPARRPSGPGGTFGRIALAAVALLLLVGAARVEEFSGRVVGVTDGDTITVLRDSHPTTVRLVGIDAPEKTQAYGQRAKQFAASLAFGQTVTVHATGHDRYMRLLAEVILPDGRSLNQELVRAGFAWWFRKYSHDLTLAHLEEGARDERRGLWADPSPEAPWTYRSHRASYGTTP